MTDTAPPNDSPVTDETLPTAEELHELWDDPPGLWGRICAVPWRRGPPARTGWSSKDDYDGELRYDRRPLRAVQALDPARVAFFGSASKALAPGLRVAWCVVPVDLVDDVLAAQASIGGPAVSRVEQLVLAELLRSGRYDAQVRRARAAYGHRRDMLVEAVERHVPSVRVEGVAA